LIEIIRLPEVMRQTGKCKSTIYSDIKAGRFPPQVRVGLRSVGWVKGRVQRHLKQLVKESENRQRKEAALKRAFRRSPQTDTRQGGV